MIFELTVLGTSSASPSKNRQPAAQILNINEHLFLIDCGEGTQVQLKRFKIRFHRITHIFISHLHGDHYLGLLGLILSMHLEGRKNELHLYAPSGLEEIINLQLKYAEATLRYPLIFHPLASNKTELIMQNDFLNVHTIPLEHRIPCNGFLFREKTKNRKLLTDKIKFYNIPVSEFESIKNGNDFVDVKGNRIHNDELTTAAFKPRSFAYCSDTAYNENILPVIDNIDMLYHEATFMHDMLERAKETYHSTTIQAGTIALKANVKKLIIGHFSARYSDLLPLLEETKTVFPEAYLAIEGNKYQVTDI